MRTLLILLFSIPLMAISIDPLLLKAQASIFPKIMLLDNEISKKTVDSKLIISILHSDKEKKSALEFKKLIDSGNKNTLGNLSLEARLVHIDKFNKADKTAAYYIFDASSSKAKSVIAHARETHRICFGYNYKDFDKEILISLFVKERTYVYLNKSVLQNYKIKFTPVFYRIVKVVE